MEKIKKLLLSDTLKLKRSLKLVLALLCLSVNSWADDVSAKPYKYCNPNLITAPFNIEECVVFFNQNTASLSPSEIKIYKANFAKAKKIKTPIMEMSNLFRTYPFPEVLFEREEASVVTAKQFYSDKVLSEDDPSTGLGIASYSHQSRMYKTVIAMLEIKNKLSRHERKMIQISKQRSECLDYWLNYLIEDATRTVNNREIIDKCFSD